MIDSLKKTWDWLKARWPWGKRQVTVKPPEEIELVPIPPPLVVIVAPDIDLPEPEPVVIRPLAVDSQIKRMSVLAVRYGRLPFGRRFTTPIPDGTLAEADRLIIGGSYAGIEANEPPEVVAPENLLVWHQAFLCAIPYP